MAQAVQTQTPQAKPPITLRQGLTWLGYAVALVLLILFLQPLLVDKPAYRIVQTAITGVMVGGVYALVALGIVVINKASGVFNFAHGYMMLLGGLLFFSLFTTAEISPVFAAVLAVATVFMVATTGGYRALLNPRTLAIAAVAAVVLTVLIALPGAQWQWVRSFVGTISGAMLLGMIVERFTIRPLIGQPLFAAVMMTLAVSQVLAGFTRLVWGAQPQRIPLFATVDPVSGLPRALQTIRIDGSDSFLGGMIILKPEQLIAFGLALGAFVVFILFFQFTNVGLAMRATAENQQLAQSVGLRVRFILAVAWAIAALLAATAGVLQGGSVDLSLNLPLLALAAFPAVLLGGLESISGALVGGLVIGLVQEFAKYLIQTPQVDTDLAPYLVLMIVLLLRPDGLFGQRRIERI